MKLQTMATCIFPEYIFGVKKGHSLGLFINISNYYKCGFQKENLNTYKLM